MERQSESDTQSGAIAQAGGDSVTAGVQAATSFEELVQAMYAAADACEVERERRIGMGILNWSGIADAGRARLEAERAVLNHLYAARPRS